MLELGYPVVMIRVTTEQDIMNNTGSYFKYIFILITLCDSKMYNIGDNQINVRHEVNITIFWSISYIDKYI